MSNNVAEDDDTHSTIIDFHNLHTKSGNFIGLGIVASVFLLLVWIAVISYLPLVLDSEAQGFDVTILTLAISAVFGIGMLLLINSIYLGTKFLRKRRELQYKFLKIQSELIRRSYLLNFELEEFEGTSRIDKIFNHLCLVFPQVNEIKKKRIKKGFRSFDEQSDSSWSRFRRKVFFLRRYDLAVRTSTGYFIVKIVEDENFKFKDVEDEINSLQRQLKIESFGMGSGNDIVSRFVFLSRHYDDSFSKDDLREKMKSIKRSFFVDLIKEDDYGYSTIWID
tara:strand:- start:2256 stop:3092 length:837 start_codon:yes stop_codon:yes gene_type:complete